MAPHNTYTSTYSQSYTSHQVYNSLVFLTNKDFVHALNYKLELTAEHQETIGHRKQIFLFDAKMIAIEK